MTPAAACAAAFLSLTTPAAADTPPRSDLAPYLRARAAEGAGQGDAALEAYRAAFAAAPASVPVAIRAYRAALAAGDGALARRAAAALTRAGAAPMDAALLPLADAARADDAAAVTRALAPLAADRLRVLVPALRVWLGREDTAPTDAASRRLAGEARALRLLGAGRVEEGFAAAMPYLPAGGAPGFRTAAAELLLGANRADLAARAADDDPAILAAARAGAAARPGLGWGVSRLLLRVADDLADAPAGPLATALARAALDADPGYARARLVLADRLGGDDPARALDELGRIPGGSPLADQVAARRLSLLGKVDRGPEALGIARALATAPDAAPRDRARYADLLFADDRPSDALPYYRRVLATPEAKASWAAWLRYGGALDEAGRWRDAEKALRRALALAPDEPQVLNYLGYSLADRGEHVAEGTRLLERAHALAPDDAAVTDSLGWAYHKAGDTPRALPLVEAAQAGLPTDPEVNDHLGDIYWTLGRRYEARYAWAAAQLTAAPRLRAAIAAKLAR